MPRLFAALVIALLATAPAAAYVGPGLGLGAVATVLATISALGLAIGGLVWFPLKRRWQSTRKARDDE